MDERASKKPRQGHDDMAKRALEYVSSNRGRSLTAGEQLDILALQANFRADTTAIPRKESVTAKVSRLLGRSTKTVGKVWSGFVARGTIVVANPPANRTERNTKISSPTAALVAIQTFIRRHCETRTRTTCKDVMVFLAEEQFLQVTMSEPVQVKTALRHVQRFVNAAGYKRGENTSSMLRLSPQNAVKRVEYVQMMTEQQALCRRVVYMDESFIHQHYSRHGDSLYDPSDPSAVKAKHKGRRLCFVAAIIDRDRTASEDTSSPHQLAGLLDETVDIFEGGKKTKDYHGMFNHEYFVKWMQTLLRCLKEQGISNCLIVMDNAKYHKVLPAATPKKGHKKVLLAAACHSYGIDVPAAASKPILWDLLSPHIDKSVVPVVVAMAREAGHEVVYTPPHHSDLQPIELVWAIVKGEVGRQYTTATKFADIRTRLEGAFCHLQPSTVQGCIDSANKQLLALKQHLDAMDAQSESSDSDVDSDECSASDSELE